MFLISNKFSWSDLFGVQVYMINCFYIITFRSTGVQHVPKALFMGLEQEEIPKTVWPQHSAFFWAVPTSEGDPEPTRAQGLCGRLLHSQAKAGSWCTFQLTSSVMSTDSPATYLWSHESSSERKHFCPEEEEDRHVKDVSAAQLLYPLQKAGITQSHFHDENLVMVVSSLFAAGTDTSSTSLRWALLLMAKYPQIQGKTDDWAGPPPGRPVPISSLITFQTRWRQSSAEW